MAERIVAILFPLFVITALGYAVARRRPLDLTQANQLNMDVFVPALVFAALAGKHFDLFALLPLVVATFVVVAGSGLAGLLLARLLSLPGRTVVPPMMFNNCGNLGLPLAVLAFGEAALAPAVAMFMVSNLLHFSFGAWLLDHRARLSTLWRVPVVLATLAGLAVSMSGVTLWPPLMTAIRMVGEISIPLMLFALGVRMTESRISAIGQGLAVAIARPLAGMGLAAGVLWLVPLPVEQAAMLLIFGALPPAVLNYIFAERYGQNPQVVASMVLIGNLAAVVFLPVALALGLGATGG